VAADVAAAAVLVVVLVVVVVGMAASFTLWLATNAMVMPLLSVRETCT
jgi:hypothetical protein